MFEMTKPMKSALKRGADLMSEREKITAAVEAAVEQLPAAAEAIKAAESALGQAEADLAVGKGANHAIEARAKLNAARDAEESLRLRIRVLERRLIEMEEEVRQVKAECESARRVFVEHVSDEFRGPYLAAAEGFLDRCREAIRLCRALGIRTPSALERVTVPDPLHGGEPPLLRIFDTEIDDNGRAKQVLPLSSEIKTQISALDSVGETLERIQLLEQELGRVASGREQAVRLQQEAEARRQRLDQRNYA